MPDKYTCDDARVFDPVLRRAARPTAWLLFEGAKPHLSRGATFDNVEFSTECAQAGRLHGPQCRIRLVSVRRRSEGPNNDDMMAVPPERLHKLHADAIRQVHDLAYPSMS